MPRLARRERAAMRRELRALEEMREEQLFDLGGLALEMHRRDSVDEELLMKRAAAIAELDDEIEALRRAGAERD